MSSCLPLLDEKTKNNAPLKKAASPEPWRKVRFIAIRRLTLEVREALRWRWYCNKSAKRHPKLQLLTPRGVVWDFKLAGGAWLRKSRLTLLEVQ